MSVEGIMNKLGIGYDRIELGEVKTKLPVERIGNIKELKRALRRSGFELLQEKKLELIELIKAYVIYWIYNADEEREKWTFSGFLSRQTGSNYSYLSKIFSEVQNMTIEQYIIFQRIEKAKELIVFNNLNFSQIAYELGYSSPAHFSYQFKNVTGRSPKDYKMKIGRET